MGNVTKAFSLLGGYLNMELHLVCMLLISQLTPLLAMRIVTQQFFSTSKISAYDGSEYQLKETKHGTNSLTANYNYSVKIRFLCYAACNFTFGRLTYN